MRGLCRFVLSIALVVASAAAVNVSMTSAHADDPTQVTVVCALKSNGLLRYVPSAAECKKNETVVPLEPGPVYICAQPDGSSRLVKQPSDCTAPPAGVTSVTVPSTGNTYFCADSTTGRMTFTTDPSTCPAGSPPISAPVINHPPTGSADAYITDEDTPLSVPAPGLLANDTDPDGNPLTAQLVAGPANSSSFTLNDDGSFSYAPAADFNGTDSFTYQDDDGRTTGDPVTVSISVTPVNDAPTASDDSYTINEDATLTVTAPGVLGNDTDVDGDPISAVLVTGPSSGTLQVNADGSFLYTPNPLFSGTDSFTYKANDGTADSNVATVTITVVHVNHAPTAVNDAYQLDEDGSLTVDAAGVLTNDVDVDGDALSAVLVTGPAHGTLSLNADGSFTYTPAALFHGSDSFTYKANDGAANSAAATVTLTVNHVNHPPIATDDVYATDEDTTLVSTAPGVLGNDSDVDGDALSAELVAGPSHGALTLNADGSFSYTAAADYNGPDSFTYRNGDGSTTSNTATVNITVNAVNDAPVLTLPTGPLTLVDGTDNSLSLSVSDVDAGGNSITLAVGADAGTLTVSTGVAGGVTDADVTGNGTGSVTISASLAEIDATLADANGLVYRVDSSAQVTLTVSVNDNGNSGSGGAQSDSGTVALNVIAAPIAGDDAYTAVGNTLLAVGATATGPHTSVDGSVLDNDSDAANDPLSTVAGTFSSTNGGTVTMAGNGTFTYLPPVGFSGPDTFTYVVTDPSIGSPLASATGNVSVAVSAPVWYVDANQTHVTTGAASDGRSTGPLPGLTTLTGSGDVDHAGDTIFVYAGSYSTALSLEGSEQLIGEAEGLTVDGQSLVAAGSAPTLSGLVTAANAVTIAGVALGAGLSATSTTGLDVADSSITNPATGNSGNGVTLTDADDVSFDHVAITDTTNSGVAGVGVTNFSFTNGSVANNGSFGSGALSFVATVSNRTALDGTVTITDNTFTNPRSHGIFIQQTAGTISSANISNNVFTGTGRSAVGIQFTIHGGVSPAASVLSATISNNTMTDLITEGIEFVAGSSSFDGGIYGTVDDPITISGNSMTNTAPNTGGAFGLDLEFDGRDSGYFVVDNNGSAETPWGNTTDDDMHVEASGRVNVTFKITNNVVVPNNAFGTALRLSVADGAGTSPHVNAIITGNTFTGSGFTPLEIENTSSAGSLNARVENNIIGTASVAGFGSFQVVNGLGNEPDPGPSTCVSIAGNTIMPGTDGSSELVVANFAPSGHQFVFGLVGLTPSPATPTQVRTFLASTNAAGGVAASGSPWTSCTLPDGV